MLTLPLAVLSLVLYLRAASIVAAAERRWRLDISALEKRAKAVEEQCSDRHRAACPGCRDQYISGLGASVRLRQSIERAQKEGPW